MLRREALESGVGLDGLVPVDLPASEYSRPVVGALGNPDAEPVGLAAFFPPGDDLQVVDVPHDPDEGLRLHQVERDPGGDVLLLGHGCLRRCPG